jgi:hypothetical protein
MACVLSKFPPFVMCLAFAVLLPGACGCNIVGAVAAKTLPNDVPPKYVGLQNQAVAVMVWADRAVRVDWNRIQLDAAAAIQNDLHALAGSGGNPSKELLGIQFPLQPAQIARFQKDRPFLETAPVTEFAPELPVTRLIYVELEQFSTRSDIAPQLYRGTAVATLKVVEIDPATNAARVAYEENGIRAGFPRQGREEGEIAGNDQVFYVETIRALAAEVANRFVTHEAPMGEGQ